MQFLELTLVMHWTFNLAQLPKIALELLRAIGSHRVVALHGGMGIGKTTLVHALCDVLGVRDPVGSPTFSIINEYNAEGVTIYHIDCYRLRNETEAIEAGVEDCLFSGEWCFVEWPEIIPHLLPGNTAIVKFSSINETTRRLDLEIKL